MTQGSLRDHVYSTSIDKVSSSVKGGLKSRKQGVPDRAVIDTTWIREISYMHVTCMS